MVHMGLHKPNVIVHTCEQSYRWIPSYMSDLFSEETLVGALTNFRNNEPIIGQPWWIRLTTLDGRIRYFKDGVEVLIEEVPPELL